MPRKKITLAPLGEKMKTGGFTHAFHGEMGQTDERENNHNNKQSFVLKRGLSYRVFHSSLFELEPDVTGVLLIICSFDKECRVVQFHTRGQIHISQ